MRSCYTAQGAISNHLRWSVVEDNMRKRMYVCMGLGHFAVQQNLTEHCKSTIIKKIFFNKEGVTSEERFRNKDEGVRSHPPLQSA